MTEPNSAFEAKLDAFGALCNQEGFTGSENATDAANDARQALLDAYAVVVAERDQFKIAFEGTRDMSARLFDVRQEFAAAKAEIERMKPHYFPPNTDPKRWNDDGPEPAV